MTSVGKKELFDLEVVANIISITATTHGEAAFLKKAFQDKIDERYEFSMQSAVNFIGLKKTLREQIKA